MSPALARSASAEIAIHISVLILVLLPILTLVFPALLLESGAIMLASYLSPESALSRWLQGDSPASPLLFVLCAVAVGLTAVLLRWKRKPEATQYKLRELSGRDGEALSNLVGELWRTTPGTSSAPPAVRWFSSMDIAAYIHQSKDQPELQISAGLWRAAVSGDLAARAILAHEIAHLKLKDPRLLKWLSWCSTATRPVLLLTTGVAILVLLAVFVDLTFQAVRAAAPFSALLLTWLQLVLAFSSVVILVPLCWLALHRQVAFITSLIEIRADIVAALWTVGMEKFTQSFASLENRRRSGNWNLLASMFSLDFTHIPERERLNILGNPVYVITPKIQFFAFSLLLVFLLPINFATPLLFSGAINYLAVLSMSAAFNCSLVLMIILGMPGGRARIHLGTRRCLGLALASYLITALPRINLEPLSYLAMSWSVGFGGTPMDTQRFAHDFMVTYRDLGSRFDAALLTVHAPLAIGANFFALRLLGHCAARRSIHGKIRRSMGLAACTIVLTVLVNIDPRMPLPADFLETLISLYDRTAGDPAILNAVPVSLTAAACYLASLNRNKDPHSDDLTSSPS